MRIFTEELYRKKEEHDVNVKKWGAFLSASFSGWCHEFDNSERHPEEYQEGASKEFAIEGLSAFKELCETDKDMARMVYESWSFYIFKMADHIGENARKYIDLLYKN